METLDIHIALSAMCLNHQRRHRANLPDNSHNYKSFFICVWGGGNQIASDFLPDSPPTPSKPLPPLAPLPLILAFEAGWPRAPLTPPPTHPPLPHAPASSHTMLHLPLPPSAT